MTQEPFNYPDLLSASAGLLGRAVEVVRQTGATFVVIGGWSPFLLNRGEIPHPGTRDVDLLFEDGAKPGALKEVVDALRGSGFVLSAKHEFQLLHVLRVAGVEFVFNVDILHASEVRKNPEMFVDHVSLPVRVSELGTGHVPARSIVVPVSGFIFDGHIVDHEMDYGSLTTGRREHIAVPLMDELGTLVTKSESMHMSKRRRDAFDVVLAVRQARDRNALAAAMGDLRSRSISAFSELSKLWALTRDSALRANVAAYWPGAQDESTWSTVREDIANLLRVAGVPDTAASHAYKGVA